MVDYVSLAVKARTLIEANGRSLTFKIVDRDPVDSAKPWRGRDAAQDITFSAKGVVYNYDAADVDGDLVRRGDKRVLVAHNSISGYDFEQVDSFLDGSDNYKVVNVGVVAPGDTYLIYEIQARL